MTYAPARLLEVRHYLQPLTGLSDNELGIVGDGAHDGGYHEGWDDRHQPSDYSWSESTRDSSHKTNAARALDVGMFARLRELSLWLVGQCAAGAPDCADIREVIYSPDGKIVKRWDRLGRRSTGDDSHLMHTHISFFADAEDRDKTAVFKRFFEGDKVTSPSRWLLNADQYPYSVANELDPIPFITNDKGEHISVPNLPLQRAKRVESKVDAIAAKVDALATPAIHLSDGDRMAIAGMVVEGLKAQLPTAEQIESAAEAAVRRVLGAVDGATPGATAQ